MSKGSGLAFVADRLGFGAEETVACGDGENDRELLDWAGFGVAVANAHEDVLARADLVVPSVRKKACACSSYLESRRTDCPAALVGAILRRANSAAIHAPCVLIDSHRSRVDSSLSSVA